ncbi:MAG: glycoside hydrolase family 27 protein [Bacteroidales bacterium]|nr:glycoside hydrolase family 27 protein [Bacteroidales bacterium]
MKTPFFLILIFLNAEFTSAQKFDSLALTPPMGWNSWNHFGCNVNEQLIRETAEAMVSSGMKDAGYVYVNIDDCWHGDRDSLGFIHPNSERFPSGMKALADYIHSLGLKIGIYSDAGWKTCAGYPGSRGHEYQDALQYAAWGIDYLKYDWCNTDGLEAVGAYLTMRNALYEAGRPIVFSLCEWGNDQPWEWGDTIGHLWRISGDIDVCFDCKVDHGTWSSWGVLQIIDMHDGIRQYVGPDHWNDYDMMEVGNGMSTNEDRAHFSMWCMLASPLIAGNDLRKMTPETLEILTKKEVIAVNQDPLGISTFKYDAIGKTDVWIKPMSNNEWAVCFLNRSTEPVEFIFPWKENPFNDKLSNRSADFITEEFSIKNLWTNKTEGTTKEPMEIKIPGHDVLLLELSRK